MKAEVLEVRPDWSMIVTKTVVGLKSSDWTKRMSLLAGLSAVSNSLLCVTLFGLIVRRLRIQIAPTTDKTYQLQRSLAIGVLIQAIISFDYIEA